MADGSSSTQSPPNEGLDKSTKSPKAADASIKPYQRIIAGCSGAIITSLLVTPLDVVKIRLQSQRKPFKSGDRFVFRNGLMDHIFTCVNGIRPNLVYVWYRKPSKFTGTMDALVKIARNEGITSLWTGLPPTMVMAVPATVIYFSTYDGIVDYLGRDDKVSMSWWKPVLAGTTARVWAVSVISPMELVRTKMQSQQLTYRFIFKALRTEIQTGGIFSLWRGLGPTLLRDVPFSAIYWLGYESLKARVLQKTGSPKIHFLESFTCGALCGTAAAILTLPFDVIKTHRQIELGDIAYSKKLRVSTWSLLKKLYNHGGISALYAGIVPRVIKVAPSCAIMISSYEFFKTFFSNINEAS